MFPNHSLGEPTDAQRRISLAAIVLWTFVIVEAIAIGVTVWYVVGGIGSR